MSSGELTAEHVQMLDRVVKDKVVAKAITDHKLRELSEAEFPKAAIAAAVAVKRRYDSDKKPLTPLAIEFIVWARDSFSGEVEQEALVCKPPLKKGDLTFDEIAGQDAAKRDIRSNYIRPYTFPGLYRTRSKGVMFYGPPGTGKCLSPDTPVLMYDGTTVEARNVRTGDKLMGDDSDPRTVLSTCEGRDVMFTITPTNGDPYTVNSQHILSLMSCDSTVSRHYGSGKTVVTWVLKTVVREQWFTGDGGHTEAMEFSRKLNEEPEFLDISVTEYISLTPEIKEWYVGYSTSVEWAESKSSPARYPPYVVGRYFVSRVDSFKRSTPPAFMDSGVNSSESADTAALLTGILPDCYKLTTGDIRRRVLAGICDEVGQYIPPNTDLLALQGGAGSSSNECSYRLTLNTTLQYNTVLFLARSLGIYAELSTDEANVIGRHIVVLEGTGLDMLPVQILPRVSQCGVLQHGVSSYATLCRHRFHVTLLGEGPYYGWCIDGNRRFLLGDFTVTHNTMLAKAATAEIPGALFYAPTPGELKGKYEGETEKSIGNVFKCAERASKANNNAPAIIFIDEFDSLAGSRGDDPSMRRSVNALLQAMDGIVETPGTSVIAASNYPWDIDDAILSRFSARVFVDLPDAKAREWMIRAALMRNYSPPGAKIRLAELYDARTGRWRGRYFDSMARYYNKSCTKDIVAGGIFSSAEKDVAISQANIVDFVNLTGPNAEGKTMLDKVASSIVDVANVTPSMVFGYSARDMVKLMTMAVGIAADRALLGHFKKVSITKNIYYISCAEDDPKADYSVIQLEDTSVIPPTAYNRILNYSLCVSDMKEALKRYPPTIRGDLYVRLLNYSLHGYSEP